MSSAPLFFALEGASWSLQFATPALQVLSRHVQRRATSKESVGQLYARDLTGRCVEINHATVLKPKWAFRGRVKFDTAQAIDERETLFEQGLHCVGLWHTHPEPRPEPSAEDRALAREHALAARPQLAGLVFAIIGTARFPRGLRVWVDDGQHLRDAASATQWLDEGGDVGRLATSQRSAVSE